MDDAGVSVRSPEIESVSYIAGYWQDCGAVSHGAMGPVPLSSQELLAWAAGSGIQLTPFEFSAILKMSRAYVGAYQDGSQSNAKPPEGMAVYDNCNREKVSKNIKNAFKTFMTDGS